MSPSPRLDSRRMLDVLRRAAGPLLVAAAVAFAVYILVRDGAALRQQTYHLDLRLILLASAVAAAAQLCSAVIWHQIAGSFGVRLPLREDIGVYTSSALAASIPGVFWLFLGRSALYSRLGANPLRVLVATVVECFLLGTASITVYAVIVIIRPGPAIWQNPIVGFACGVAAFVLIQPAVFNRLCGLALRRYGRSPDLAIASFSTRRLLGWFAADLAIIALGGPVMFALLSSFSAAPWETLVTLSATWAAAMAASNLLFFVPGTMLLRDAALVVALSNHVPLAAAVFFAAASRAWTVALLLATASCAWLILRLTRPKPASPAV